MCQMTIHATARDTTMLQAVAHNLHTSASDLETLVRVLSGRGQLTGAQGTALTEAMDTIHAIEATLLDLFEDAVERHPHTAGDHSACDGPPHGATVAEKLGPTHQAAHDLGVPHAHPTAQSV